VSYDEVAGLLERVTGQHVLSDQTIQKLVVAKAVEVSEQWQSESQADTAVPPLPAVMPQVDWYDPQSEELTFPLCCFGQILCWFPRDAP
jgi:hypothetical protein